MARKAGRTKVERNINFELFSSLIRNNDDCRVLRQEVEEHHVLWLDVPKAPGD